jgi:hypothetical protein
MALPFQDAFDHDARVQDIVKHHDITHNSLLNRLSGR